ncbi:MAG: VanZ family protein [Candidatus Omnitrophica bacterium]|nr:VanZ family protein [Candidatus Omnitrophota bacterium]
MNREKKSLFYKFWLPPIAYAVLIFILSSISAYPVLFELDIMDEIVHIFEYAILGLLLMRAFANSNLTISFKKQLLLSVVIAAFYGLSDEYHQFFVPGRNASAIDAAFDCLGSLAGSVLYYKKFLV